MQLKGEEHIPLDPALVWAALNQPDVLKAAIPGCETLEETEEGFRIGMLAAVGPVRARFNGKLVLADVCAPTSYTLMFEGSGGVAGFGKGTAHVRLAEVEGGTCLSYEATAQVGGKIAQVGSRLIDGVAARMAGEFFSRFKDCIVPPPATPEAPAPGGTRGGLLAKLWS
ncbi:carbon monoxide dehydrogenase subunit G [Ramlibacter sp. AW1]|uniref:Carbon monoxide dehydrogenase subunit G n=1 Tax=Ramlibacter aurantiacus TaxID=2801330 RepID=A0A937D3G7_9BURK|nr:carbon monoxide dehydrogenase subunit G [Ramlibacter aurantiacus]MBL0422644.1 carbon monoxide dehydrogenase subunit G [Ramlibacter aurantiacus]